MRTQSPCPLGSCQPPGNPPAFFPEGPQDTLLQATGTQNGLLGWLAGLETSSEDLGSGESRTLGHGWPDYSPLVGPREGLVLWLVPPALSPSLSKLLFEGEVGDIVDSIMGGTWAFSIGM